jgi:hypothetical protein
MLNLIYDHFAESMEDPVVNKIVVSSQRLFGAFVPVRPHKMLSVCFTNYRAKTSHDSQGAYLVDLLPFLRFIPTWFPGADFKRKAIAWAEEDRELYMTLYDDVEARLKDSSARACLVSKMQETQSKTGLNRTEMSYIAGSLFAAGTDVRKSVLIL